MACRPYNSRTNQECTFTPPAEALKSARPLPKREDLVIEDVSDEEWAAFLEALAEA